MASLYTPQSQAGVMSFYDAPSKGPKLNPKIVLIAIFVFGIIIILIDHFAAL
ncbi:preprotein translocase subunit Sec61beta [Candidatus Marsarchaeota archaeon]|jgi:preprotein translocase subunit Sec61beta|nr:preprotein translocase subunit Sec61beta [Candidatus Marsarchaeota archaeon]MCL5090351.1 preprotein translocase subunit Sec61beta [Candidatus Marsarchaeota archaeon]